MAHKAVQYTSTPTIHLPRCRFTLIKPSSKVWNFLSSSERLANLQLHSGVAPLYLGRFFGTDSQVMKGNRSVWGSSHCLPSAPVVCICIHLGRRGGSGGSRNIYFWRNLRSLNLWRRRNAEPTTGKSSRGILFTSDVARNKLFTSREQEINDRAPDRGRRWTMIAE